MSNKPISIRILLADDHELVRTGVAFMIKRQDDMSVVGQAKNGIEACELYKQTRPDVVLLDLKMPDLSGVECVRKIRAFDPGARILILTTYDTDEDIQDALQAGARGYLLKDVLESELIAWIRKASQGQTCVVPAVAAKLADRLRQVQLTAREMDVLKLMTDGKTNKEIAAGLFITESTVKLHANNLFQKLNVSNRTEAMKVAIQRGLVRLPT